MNKNNERINTFTNSTRQEKIRKLKKLDFLLGKIKTDRSTKEKNELANKTSDMFFVLPAKIKHITDKDDISDFVKEAEECIKKARELGLLEE
jgi:hypothetical protein